MKVQTSDDGKLINGEEKTSDGPAARSSTSGPYTIDYELKPAPQDKYVNLSKLVLLILAIIATFLACLIFARDLWGQKNAEKTEILHHRAPHAKAQSQHRFPLDDFMDDLEDPFDLGGNVEEQKFDEEPHLVKKTKITFKLIPKDGDDIQAPFGMKKIEFGGPTMDDGIFEDILKSVMGMMNPPEGKRPVFGDLPFFDGPNNPRPTHPKLIILRKLPTPQEDADVMQNLLSMNEPPLTHPADKYKRPSSMVPIPMIRPIHINDVQNGKPDLISSILKGFGLGGPLGPIMINRNPTNDELSGPEGWKKYKSLISQLAQEVDVILERTSSLKQTVVEELNKVKDTAETSDALKAADPAKNFLSSALESLNKIGASLTDVSIVVKTEDGAMDLVDKTDKKTLANTIDSFLKELNGPLGEVFAASTALTKTAGKDGVSAPVLQGIVGMATKIVDFGKIVYEDLSKLLTAVGHSQAVKPVFNIPNPPEPVPELKPEPQPQPSDNPAEEPPRNVGNASAEPIEAVRTEAVSSL